MDNERARVFLDRRFEVRDCARRPALDQGNVAGSEVGGKTAIRFRPSTRLLRNRQLEEILKPRNELRFFGPPISADYRCFAPFETTPMFRNAPPDATPRPIVRRTKNEHSSRAGYKWLAPVVNSSWKHRAHSTV